MIDATQIANRYVAVWNETDPARRRALLREGWTENTDRTRNFRPFQPAISVGILGR
jgi:hypothetical protein